MKNKQGKGGGFGLWCLNSGICPPRPARRTNAISPRAQKGNKQKALNGTTGSQENELDRPLSTSLMIQTVRILPQKGRFKAAFLHLKLQEMATIQKVPNGAHSFANRRQPHFGARHQVYAGNLGGRAAAARRLSVVLTLKHLEPPAAALPRPGSCLRES